MAISKQAIFWQQWEVAQGIAGRGIDLVQAFGNLLFGYLIVAYFVGAQLTKVQLAILNALYLIWQVRIFLLIYGAFTNAHTILGEMRKISPDYDPATPSMLGVLALLSVLTLASLYFMWSIRHPKKE